MRIHDGVVYAEAFGGDFPVCNEKQALEMEKAYAEAKAATSGEPESGDCTCDLIIKLLKGTASRGSMFTAGAAVAQDIYMKKVIISGLTRAMEEAVLSQPVRAGETVH